jgi:lycopene cyclase domain-containing protein
VSYTQLAIAAAVLALAIDLLLTRTALVRRKAFWVSYAIVLIGQLLVNGVLTGARVVRYDPRAIIGVRVIFAPVEDLLFGFAMVLITLSSWVWLGRREHAAQALHGDRG